MSYRLKNHTELTFEQEQLKFSKDYRASERFTQYFLALCGAIIMLAAFVALAVILP